MKKALLLLSLFAVPAFAGDALPSMDGLKKDAEAAKVKAKKEGEAVKKDANKAGKKVEEKTK